MWLLRRAGSAVVLVLSVLALLRLPETFLEEVDQGLAQVLPGAVAVQEVPFIGVDLRTEGCACVKAFSLKHFSAK